VIKYYKKVPLSELKLSERMAKLKDELLDAPRRYSTLNAQIAKKSYDSTEGQPVIIRRAKALKAAFDEMPIYIREHELLVGNRSEGLGVMPKLQEEYIAIENPRTGTDDARYEEKDIYGCYLNNISDEIKAAQKCLWAGYPAGSSSGFGHIMADYNMILRYGAYALAEKAEAQAKVFEEKGMERERDFCEASSIACRAFGNFGKRYAQLAQDLAKECSCPERSSELIKMAEVCDRVPAYPATSFYEAIQAFFFSHQAMMIEQQGGSISIGGFDRILYEYYIRDIENKALSVYFAELLIENFYIKVMENAIWPRFVTVFANMAVGGQNEAGRDRSNDLSWMALDTLVKTGSTHPLPSVRWHPDIDKEFWMRAVEIVGKGLGLPALFSDTKIIEALISLGVPREKAIDYGIVGCVEPAILGELHGQTLGGHINTLMCLELALNDGKRFITGEQLGPRTGAMIEFRSMEDVWKAYRTQVEAACRINMEAVYASAKAQQEKYGYPLMSSLMHNAVEQGRDIAYGAKWNFPTVCVTGITNVVDSFLAMEHLVENTGKYTFAEFYDEIKCNYKGSEKLLSDIRGLDKKFGNGNAEYPRLYNKVCEVHDAIFEKQPGPRGDRFASGIWPVTWHVSQGAFTGASPDGRLAGEPLVDSAGPVSGRAKNGPTALILDMASIDSARHWPGGYVLNVKFSKDLFKTEENIEKIASLIDTFFRIGGMQMQINTHSSELLRKAKAEPEKYKDIVVRVAGYSAYFCALDEGVQDEIISRAEVTV
jgi:formate C-acetyltransferase